MERVELTKTQQERYEVAIHEVSHAVAGRHFGWDINNITVVPEENTLGLTKLRPNSYHPDSQLLLESAAIAAASEIGEEMFGIEDHSGCGSDRFMQKVRLSIFRFNFDSDSTLSSLITRTRSMARWALQSSRQEIEDRAYRLAIVGTI